MELSDLFIIGFTGLFIATCIFGAIDFYKSFIKKEK